MDRSVMMRRCRACDSHNHKSGASSTLPGMSLSRLTTTAIRHRQAEIMVALSSRGVEDHHVRLRHSNMCLEGIPIQCAGRSRSKLGLLSLVQQTPFSVLAQRPGFFCKLFAVPPDEICHAADFPIYTNTSPIEKQLWCADAHHTYQNSFHLKLNDSRLKEAGQASPRHSSACFCYLASVAAKYFFSFFNNVIR